MLFDIRLQNLINGTLSMQSLMIIKPKINNSKKENNNCIGDNLLKQLLTGMHNVTCDRLSYTQFEKAVETDNVDNGYHKR